MLIAAAVKVLIPGIERDREQAAGLPLEAVFAFAAGAVGRILPDARRPPAGHDIYRQFIQMMLRFGFASGFDLDHVTVVRHVPIVDMDHRATAALSLPCTQLDLR